MRWRRRYRPITCRGTHRRGVDRRRRGDRRGSSVLVAMVLVTLLSGAIGLLHGSVGMDILSFRQDARRAELQALLDAATAASLAGLASDAAFRGVSRAPFGEGEIESRVVAREAGPGDGREAVIVAVARAGGSEESLRAVVALGPDGVRVVSWERAAWPPAPSAGGVLPVLGKELVVPQKVD